MHELIAALGMRAHPEGGWYAETWRSPVRWTPPGYPGERACATAILFLLLPGEESRWHRVRGAETWCWHAGGPLTLSLGGDGERPEASRDVLLGADVLAGQSPQATVPGGHWQAAAPAEGQHALVSCLVAPGFDFADFTML